MLRSAPRSGGRPSETPERPGFVLPKIEDAKMALDRPGDSAYDLTAQLDFWPEHLQVFLRQKFVAAVNRVAAHLHGVLGRAHNRGADASRAGASGQESAPSLIRLRSARPSGTPKSPKDRDSLP